MTTAETQAQATEPPTFWLEQHQRLSRSLLWKLQRAFFEQRGIQAWSRGTVPHYVTSNPFIAGAYARVVFGFLRDCLNPANALLAADQPIYIVELGSGSGRFSFHFLQKFLQLLKGSTLQDSRITYVMTDFAQSNIDYFRAHPSLQPFVAQGVLDYALFDAERTEGLALTASGTILAPESVKNPMIFFANYFFDSLPQDTFSLSKGTLHEALVALSSTQEEPDLSEPEILKRVKVSYEERPIGEEYYGDPDLDGILRYYRQHLASTAILFPCAALHCLQRLRRLSGGRMLLLSGDKGYIREEALLARPKPGLVVHGSFSLMVNYHAIARYIQDQGGEVLHTQHLHTSINICAFLLGNPPHGYGETKHAYGTAIEEFSPDDYFTLSKWLEKNCASLSLEQMLAYLRLSGWDASVFFRCYSTLLDQLQNVSEPMQQELFRAVQQIWDNYYHIGEERDLPFSLGRVLLRMAYYPEALDYFQHSLHLYGSDPRTHYNMALCHNYLRHLDAALEHANQALQLDPGFDSAKALRIRIQAKLSRSL